MARSSIFNLFLSIETIGLLLLFGACNFKSKNTENLSPVKTDRIILDSLKAIALGEQLFFDKRLSSDNSTACATCHDPKKAFTDGKRVSTGVGGGKSMRNSPTLLTLYAQPYFMHDGGVPTLEMQAIVPIQEHTEMNMQVGALIEKLSKIPFYVSAVEKTYNGNIDAWILTKSLALYQRSLMANNSRFDDYYTKGNIDALSDSEKRGWVLFSEKLNCIDCHTLPHFSNFELINNGLTTDYQFDSGRFRITLDSNDIGKFKVPTLRNIELTSPYLHDGRIKTLEEIIDGYQEGGSEHPNTNKLIKPFSLLKQEKNDLVSFLKSLTDTTYLTE